MRRWRTPPLRQRQPGVGRRRGGPSGLGGLGITRTPPLAAAANHPSAAPRAPLGLIGTLVIYAQSLPSGVRHKYSRKPDRRQTAARDILILGCDVLYFSLSLLLSSLGLHERKTPVSINPKTGSHTADSTVHTAAS